MILVKCDHCKIDIKNARTDIHKNFFQVLGDDGKVEADLCKKCYEEWCMILDNMDKDSMKAVEHIKKDFKKRFLK